MVMTCKCWICPHPDRPSKEARVAAWTASEPTAVSGWASLAKPQQSSTPIQHARNILKYPGLALLPDRGIEMFQPRKIRKVDLVQKANQRYRAGYHGASKRRNRQGKKNCTNCSINFGSLLIHLPPRKHTVRSNKQL